MPSSVTAGSPSPRRGTTATTAKTPPLETVEDLAEMLDHLWRHVESNGRDRSEIDVSFGTGEGGHPGRDRFEPEAKLEAIDELARLGVTWTDVWRWPPAT